VGKLTKCRDCGETISKNAESCPHCGASRKKKRGTMGLGSLIVVLGLGFYSYSTIVEMRNPTPVEPAPAKKPVLTSAQCMKDIQCWSSRHDIDAVVACKRPIEKYAKYQHRWQDGILSPTFPRVQWKDEKSGVVTYIGDKVQFQNGFGAWQNYRYECDYSPKAQQALAVRVTPM